MYFKWQEKPRKKERFPWSYVNPQKSKLWFHTALNNSTIRYAINNKNHISSQLVPNNVACIYHSSITGPNSSIVLAASVRTSTKALNDARRNLASVASKCLPTEQ